MDEETKNKVYGVSELTDVIKGLLKPFDRIFVEGEISGWKVYASGHAYFTLKDEGAQLSCVMFALWLRKVGKHPVGIEVERINMIHWEFALHARRILSH